MRFTFERNSFNAFRLLVDGKKRFFFFRRNNNAIDSIDFQIDIESIFLFDGNIQFVYKYDEV